MENRIAEIQIGGNTEVEQGEIRDKVIDCMNSAKQAIEFGILPGGGTSLYQASKILKESLHSLEVKDKHELAGFEVLVRALKAPITQLIHNSTGKHPALYLHKIDEAGDFYTGYDLRTSKHFKLFIFRRYLQHDRQRRGRQLLCDKDCPRRLNFPRWHGTHY
jgi:chaperonin GroEL